MEAIPEVMKCTYSGRPGGEEAAADGEIDGLGGCDDPPAEFGRELIQHQVGDGNDHGPGSSCERVAREIRRMQRGKLRGSNCGAATERCPFTGRIWPGEKFEYWLSNTGLEVCLIEGCYRRPGE